jgi:nicotinamidase-related amidase
MRVVSGVEVLDQLAERVRPEHTALVVVDMQNDYCSPGGAGDRNGRDLTDVQAIIPRTARLIDAARATGVPIVFLRYTIGPATAGLSGPEIMRRGVLFANVEATIKGTWGHEIVDGLPYQPDQDVVIDKRRLSGFVGTELDHFLHSRGVKTIVVTGVVTQGCVETTVRDAACYDYYVAVVEDCCASTSRQLHEAGIGSMRTFLRYDQAIVTSDDLVGLWQPQPLPSAVGG